MDYKTIESQNYRIEREYYDLDNNWVIELSSSHNVPECPHCNYNKAVKYGKNSRTVKDLFEGKPALIKYKKIKYKCKYCGSFFQEADLYPEKQRIGNALLMWITRYLLEDPYRSLQDAADKVGVSRTSVNGAIHDHMEQIVREKLVTLEFFPCLILYPVVYQKKRTCFIFGTDFEKNTNRTTLHLLWILSEYDGIKITDFLSEKFIGFVNDVIDILYHDIDIKAFGAFSRFFEKDLLVIPRELFLDRVKKARVAPEHIHFNAIAHHLSALSEAIKKDTSKNDQKKRITNWCENIPDEIDELMSLRNDIQICIQPCIAGLRNEDEYNSIQPLLHKCVDYVHHLNRNHVTFEEMRYRILFSCARMIDDSGVERNHSISVSFQKLLSATHIYGFSVDVEELLDHLS